MKNIDLFDYTPRFSLVQPKPCMGLRSHKVNTDPNAAAFWQESNIRL